MKKKSIIDLLTSENALMLAFAIMIALLIFWRADV